MRDPWTRFWLYAAVLVTGAAFSIVFTGESVLSDGAYASDTPGRAFLVMAGAATAALLVGSAGRYRFVLLPPVTVLYTLFAVYGWPPLFTPSEWQGFFVDVGADLYEAAGIMYLEPVPYDVVPGLLVVMIPVVMAVAAFSTSFTLYERSPVISVAVLGITVGILSTSTFETGAGVFFFLFVVSAVGLLLSTGAGRSVGRPALWAGTGVVLLVLLLPRLPFADLTTSPGLIDWTRIGSWGTPQLDVQADVGDYLDSGRDAELMVVRSEEPLLWRGGTLDHFDGVRWSDTTNPGDPDGEEIAADVPTRTVVQGVRVLNAETDLIFGGYRISAVSLPSAEPNSDGSWSVGGTLAEDSYYRVLSEIPQPTARQLRQSGTAYPTEVRERFLQLPENLPDEVSQTAREIERSYNVTTPYSRARVIERYLRLDGGFTYNLDADYRRADRALERFLGDEREGFCTQFATSMALIAREMGMPSRVVYGATQGREEEPGEWVVTGANIHTWVEIYFPGVGWYPFDPTPGFSMPSAMEANAPRPQMPSSMEEEFLPQNPANLGETPGANPGQQQDTPRAEESAGQGSGLPPYAYATFAALLLAAGPALKRALLARGRPEDLYRDLTGRLRDVLAPGRGSVADSPALTPTERLLLLAGAVGLDEQAFKQFGRAYSDHLYSPDPGSDVAEAYREALREFGRLPGWRRLLGLFNPASLFYRAGRGLGALRGRVGKALRRWFRNGKRQHR